MNKTIDDVIWDLFDNFNTLTLREMDTLYDLMEIHYPEDVLIKDALLTRYKEITGKWTQ